MRYVYTLAILWMLLIRSQLHAVTITELVVFGASESRSSSTNGPTWIDYLANDLNVPLKNFARSGSGGNTAGTGLQVASYLEANEPAAGTLFVSYHWGSGIDVLQGSSPSQAASGALANIDTLVDAGGTQFVSPTFSWLPLLAPLFRERPDAELWKTNSAMAYDLVDDQLRNLESAAGITVYRPDQDLLFQQIVQNPLPFGLTNITDPVEGSPHNPDPDEYLWWDSVHWTTATHRIVADDVLKSIPEPSSLGLLSIGMIVLAALHRRPQSCSTSV